MSLDFFFFNGSTKVEGQKTGGCSLFWGCNERNYNPPIKSGRIVNSRSVESFDIVIGYLNE